MLVRWRANSTCMASLSPAAIRSTNISSEEYSPAVAAIAGTAAAAEPEPVRRLIACDFPYFTSRQNKTGKGKKFRKLFRPNGRNQRFACALLALFGHLLGSKLTIGARVIRRVVIDLMRTPCPRRPAPAAGVPIQVAHRRTLSTLAGELHRNRHGGQSLPRSSVPGWP